ncbi:DUF4191 domain-containing protein [Arthrobacter sp. UM1]|uniref:DUF4191 domain-containing protein n=1 Tax=Arthrobacter sp. UM1 TaxID=2766776 RepID=UPI001CF6F344|nr:DUF4191 domain-containing protein [Arthrobacter sp. UM1]MCB4207679.1 DUF4191 domain-containing protein [Arthrobacter sp. UM1]
MAKKTSPSGSHTASSRAQAASPETTQGKKTRSRDTLNKDSQNKVAQTRDKKSRDKQNRSGQPGRLAQMRQAFDLTRRNDSKLVPYMLIAFLGAVLVFLALGLLLHNWITFLILGILVGVLAAMLILSMRAQNAALSQLEGQPGGSRAAMSLLRRGWSMPEEPVAMNPKSKDLVFRAVGRPGVVLVTEGPNSRVKQLVNAEKLKMRRILPDVPVHVINSGTQEGQVRLQDIVKTMRKLPPSITKDEVYVVDRRLASMGQNSAPIPKGIDPTKVRANRKGMRGR